MINPFAWIRDAIGIRKDVLETEKLEDEKQDRESLIHKATMEDVERYDRRVRALRHSRAAREEGAGAAHVSFFLVLLRVLLGRASYVWIWIILGILGALGAWLVVTR